MEQFAPNPSHQKSVLLLLRCMLSILILASAAGIAFADTITARDAEVKAPEIFEHMIDYMVSLELALFAAVGFFGRNGLAKHYTGWQVSAGFVFVLFGAASLFFAYQSHLELMTQLASGTFDYKVMTNYVPEAVTLLISSIAAFIFSAIALWT